MTTDGEIIRAIEDRIKKRAQELEKINTKIKEYEVRKVELAHSIKQLGGSLDILRKEFELLEEEVKA